MVQVRKSHERGHVDHGWLDSYHTFSFADYYDREQMGFGSLRVINEDRVQPGRGFGTHGHRDMEIISYVLEGALQHSDSMGNGSVIHPGDVQRMSAGSGVQHSEFNASDVEWVHFLQIWIVPKFTGLKPAYEQKHFSSDAKRNRLRLVASSDGRDGSVTIHQDASLYAALLEDDGVLIHALAPGRRAYIQVARGQAQVNGVQLSAGDGARIFEEDGVTLKGEPDAEVLLFDLA